MGQNKEEKLKKQWSSIAKKHLSDLSDLPKDCVFHKGSGQKLSIENFILGFFLMVLSKGNSLNHWAMQIGTLCDNVLSKQGLSKKLQMRVEYFIRQLLLVVLRRQLQYSHEGQSADKTDKTDKTQSKGLLSIFPNVYLEDSTCMKVPDNLSKYLPSSYSKNKECATARIQVCLNLKSSHLTDISVQSYRDNDQKHAPHIVKLLKKGDLVIRDLGYCVLSVFKTIIVVQAFFLSRLRLDITIYKQDEPQLPLDLCKYLRKCEINGQTQVDFNVFAGKKERLPARFVALKLPQAVANEKRRKANNNRDKRCSPNADSLYLMGWAIFLTNVTIEVWNALDLPKVYRMRWRIEIIFKTWKSHFDFGHIFQAHSMTYPRALISFYLLLLFIILFFVQWFDYFTTKIQENSKEKTVWLSIFKFADWVTIAFYDICNAFLDNNLDLMVQKVQHFCAYDKRNRPNDAQTLYYFFNG